MSKLEAQQPLFIAQYIASQPYAFNLPISAFPGLLEYEYVTRPLNHFVLISYWRSSDDYNAQRAMLEAQLGNDAVPECTGLLARRSRSTQQLNEWFSSIYSKVSVALAALGVVAVATGNLDDIRDFLLKAFAAPNFKVVVPDRDILLDTVSEVSYELKNLGEVAGDVEVDKIESSDPALQIKTDLKQQPALVRDLAAGASAIQSIRVRASKPGTYLITVENTQSAGFWADDLKNSAELRVRVWEPITFEMRSAQPVAGKKSALCPMVVSVGRDYAEGYGIGVELSAAHGLAFKGVQGEVRGIIREQPQDKHGTYELIFLEWSVPALTKMTRLTYMIIVEADRQKTNEEWRELCARIQPRPFRP